MNKYKFLLKGIDAFLQDFSPAKISHYAVFQSELVVDMHVKYVLTTGISCVKPSIDSA